MPENNITLYDFVHDYLLAGVPEEYNYASVLITIFIWILLIVILVKLPEWIGGH